METRRGMVALVLAHAVFFAGSYGVHFVLGRALGPEAYGAFGVVLSVLGALTIVVSTGIPQGVSRLVAADANRLRSALWTGGALQLAAGLLLAGIYAAAAPALGTFLRDQALVPLFRLSAVAVLAYAVYSLVESALLGLGRFVAAAWTIGAFTALKVGTVAVVLWVGWGVEGVLLAWFAGAFGAFLVSLVALGRVPRGGPASSWRDVASFGVPMLAVNLALFALANADVLFVKRAAEEAAVGGYVAAATLGRIPYYLFSALALVALPALSRAHAARDDALARRTLGDAARGILYVLLPGAMLTPFVAGGILTLAYGAEYSASAPALALLVVAALALTAFHVSVNAAAAAGSPRRALLTTLAVLIPAFAAFEIGGRWAGPVGVAAAVLGVFTMGAVVTGLPLIRRYGPLVPARTVRNAALAAAPVLGVGAMAGALGGPWAAVGGFGIGYAAWGATLHLLGEFDLRRWRSIFSPVPPGAEAPPGP